MCLRLQAGTPLLMSLPVGSRYAQGPEIEAQQWMGYLQSGWESTLLPLFADLRMKNPESL